MPDIATDPEFAFGDARVNAVSGANCCGWPRGCTNMTPGCLHLRHPWKRAVVLGDRTVRCQATATDPETGDWQCSLLNGHDGPCKP